MHLAMFTVQERNYVLWFILLQTIFLFHVIQNNLLICVILFFSSMKLKKQFQHPSSKG
jgi:hypothetical protein